MEESEDFQKNDGASLEMMTHTTEVEWEGVGE